MEEFEELKPIKNSNEFERWNLEDLEHYKKNLKEEILKIQKIIDGKNQISNSVSDLFKS